MRDALAPVSWGPDCLSGVPGRIMRGVAGARALRRGAWAGRLGRAGLFGGGGAAPRPAAGARGARVAAAAARASLEVGSAAAALDGLKPLLPPAGSEGAPVAPLELVGDAGGSPGDAPVVLSLIRHFG